MAYSPVENKYLSALTAVQFPTEPVEPEPVAQPERAMAPGQRPGDILVAEVGSRGLPQQAYTGVIPDTIKEYDPTVRERLASFLQAGFEGMGVDRFKARQNAQTILGGPSSNLPLNMGLADVVPFLGTGLQTQEAVRMGEDAATSVQQGNYGTAALQTGGAVLGLVPGVAGTVKAAKPLIPKAAEMTINALEKTGMPVRGLGIVEQAPQLAVERVPGVKPGDELIVQHNLTASNLMKADKLGGLPVPSLAISKVGAPLENFGEITLIGPREMASPSSKNPIFASDAYTKRFPTIDYQIDSKSQKTLKSLLSDVAEKIPGGDYKVERLLNDWNDRKYSDILAAKFLDERGELPNQADFSESWKFDSALREAVSKRKGEFTDWLEKFDSTLPDNGVNVKERIFKGFTYSGNRRYSEVNLTNLVNEMKGGAGGENFNYGVGNLRAVATPKFKTLNQIKASRGSIVDSDKMESVKNQTQEAYFELLNRLREVNKDYSAEDALLELAQSKRISTLDRIYDSKLPDALKADIGVFLSKIQELPTEYFEIKPQRAVSLEEFKGAIIPKDTPQAARAVLKKAGITDIHEYSTPEERKGLFDKFGKEMFATMPAAPLVSETMQDKEKK